MKTKQINPTKKRSTKKADMTGQKWEEKTHARIVLKAVDMMMSYAQHGSNLHVKDFINYFHNSSFGDFTDSLLKGLKDADEKSPWTDNNFASHFYNPKTRKNFYSGTNNTAYVEALRYFKLSEHYARRIIYFMENRKKPGEQLYTNAGYYLGLSLHFFTDLTQPMHAANFTNVFGDEGNWVYRPDLRHAGFEVYTDNAIERGLLNDLAPLNDSHLDQFRDNYVGNYIDYIALKSKDIFDKNFKPILDKKFEKYMGWEVLAQGFWRSSEADQLIDLTTKLAPYYVAKYLTNWTMLAKLRPAAVSRKWYHILEPTKAPANQNDLDKFEVSDLSSGLSQWVQRWERNGGDNQKFYLINNADGTVCIGCKDNPKRIWLVAESYSVGWIGQARSVSRATLFRITPYNDKKIIIFESTKNEVVHVNTNKTGIRDVDDWPGYYLRWAPSYDENQWFILQEAGNISNEEAKEIKSNYPHYEAYDWAGDSNTVPEWESKIPVLTGLDLLSKRKGTKKLTKTKTRSSARNSKKAIKRKSGPNRKK